MLTILVVISGCTQEGAKEYKYNNITLQEPRGWEKSTVFTVVTSNGQKMGPDDILFTNGEKGIFVSSSGNLDSVINVSKDIAETTVEDKTIGKY